jgi:hypothetical protein
MPTMSPVVLAYLFVLVLLAGLLLLSPIMPARPNEPNFQARMFDIAAEGFKLTLGAVIGALSAAGRKAPSDPSKK